MSTDWTDPLDPTVPPAWHARDTTTPIDGVPDEDTEGGTSDGE